MNHRTACVKSPAGVLLAAVAAGCLLAGLAAAQEIKAPTFHLPDAKARKEVIREMERIQPAIKLLSEADTVLGPVFKAYQADPTPEAYEALQREFSAYCANLSGAFGKALNSRSKLTVAFQKLTEGMWRLGEEVKIYAHDFRRNVVTQHEEELAKQKKQLQELAEKYLEADSEEDNNAEKERLEYRFLTQYYAVEILDKQVAHLRQAADFYQQSADRALQWAAGLDSLRSRMQVSLALMRSCADTLGFIANMGENRIKFQAALRELFDSQKGFVNLLTDAGRLQDEMSDLMRVSGALSDPAALLRFLGEPKIPLVITETAKEKRRTEVQKLVEQVLKEVD